MEFLARFHPQIVHFPIALILVSVLLELIGRVTDLEWWRKAAFTVLIFGVLGAGAAVLSGNGAGEKAEHAGVAESAVDAHGDAGRIAFYLGLAAVVVRAVAGRTGRARGAVGALGLVLQLLAASAVGMAGYRGGKLVYEHGANVRVNGVPVVTAPAGGEKGEQGEKREHREREGS
jgi:uncharacterized membrane protein